MAKQAFLGIGMKTDSPAGKLEVGSVMPGPLYPQDESGDLGKPSIDEGDVILAVNGKPVDSAGLKALVDHAHPGDGLTLRVQHAEKQPAQDHQPTKPGIVTVRNLTVRLEPKSRWSGPIAFPRPAGLPFDNPALQELPGSDGPLEQFIRTEMERAHLSAGFDKLQDYFAQTLAQHGGFHMLSRVAYGFQHPVRLPELQRAITGPMASIVKDPRLALFSGADNLDVPRPVLCQPPDLSNPVAALHWMESHVEASRRHLDKAFARLTPHQRALMPRLMEDLLDVQSQLEYLSDSPQAPRLIRAPCRPR